ncbi:hypothetical protein Tco_1524389 [Tanacetum coccineum]
MIALLNDLSYIPPHNEQNKPTQGDIGETSNEPTQAKRNEFEELYASANEELYPGCDYVTRLDFMAKFTYFKVKGKLTDSIFNEMLEFFQPVFPTTKGYKIIPSYYAIKKIFKTTGLGYESIHACVNDCFRGDNNKDVHFCPVCKTSRWKDSNTPEKKFPKKVLRYFPIIYRLQRLYKSSQTAKETMNVGLRLVLIRQRHVDNDPGVSTTSELFAFACGPTPTPLSVNSSVVNDGQSTEVDAPLYIIDLDEDDDIIDDEDALPYDLADSDDEDLVNVDDDDDDDDVDVMSADVARGHGDDGGGDDRPPTHHIPTGCGGCFTNRGKGTRKLNLGGRKAGRLHTRQETHNLGLKKITDDKGPIPIRFEWDDKKTMTPLGDHASHCSNYLGELIRDMPLYYPSWQKVPTERKAAILTKIGWSSSSPRRVTARMSRHLLLDTHCCGAPTPRRVCPNTEERDHGHLVRRARCEGHLPGICRSDNKFSQMLDQFESSPEFGGPSGGGGCGDHESGGNEDDNEDEEDGDS